jgi:hypothetical protein
MKKVFVNPLQEILDVHVTGVQDYLEDALRMILKNYLGATSGVIHGLQPSINSGLILGLSNGAIVVDGIYGEFETPITLTLEGTSSPLDFRTDLIVASYEEIFDFFTSGYVLLDVSTRAETIQSLPSRKFGTIKLEQLQNTTYLQRPANKIPICEVTLNSTQIDSVADYRLFSTISRFKEELQIDFNSLFYGSLY